MVVFELVSDGWRSGPVLEASSFLARWRGLRPRPDRNGLLIDTRSVHTIGMSVPIWAISIDARDIVQAVRRLEPWRIFLDRRAHWVLELPIDRVPPVVGAKLARS